MNSKHTLRERGATLVELALALTLLLVFVFGTLDFSQAAYTYHFVSEVTREATRYAMVRGSACRSLPDCNVSGSQVGDYVKTLVPAGIDPSGVTVTTTWLDSGTGQCPAGDLHGPGCAVNVKVTYTYRFNFPLISRLTSIDMSSTSQMVISQ